MARPRRISLGVPALALVLVACGSSSSDSAAPPAASGQGGAAGASAGGSGGSHAGSGGASAGASGSGGTSSGGASGHGGSAMGGSATGGSATGGSSNGGKGGSSQGGSSQGGSSTGGSATGGTTGSGGSGGAAAMGHVKTVFLILMENHNWSDIYKSSSAPYLNSLLNEGAWCSNYKNPPGNHPSEPNYIWLEAGQNFGIADDNPPSVNHQSSTKHLATLLKDANVSWKEYAEDISGKQCPLTSVKNYAPKHDPFVFFDDSTGNLDANDPYCIAHNRPYTELATDLAGGNVAAYNFITPNLCDDMHNACAPVNDNIKQGDTWLSQQVPMIMASDAYKNDGAIFITWDESEGGDFPIGMIVLSPLAKVGYQSKTAFTHSSTLKTMQEIFGVTPLLGDAASPDTSDLAELFQSL